jgi:hypothetical protein
VALQWLLPDRHPHMYQAGIQRSVIRHSFSNSFHPLVTKIQNTVHMDSRSEHAGRTSNPRRECNGSRAYQAGREGREG